jgi:hypothetical protein
VSSSRIRCQGDGIELPIPRRFPLTAYEALLKRDPCAYCGRVSRHGSQIDHIVPRAFGGLNHWSNYAAACEPCNALKSIVPMLIWLGALHEIVHHARATLQATWSVTGA